MPTHTSGSPRARPDRGRGRDAVTDRLLREARHASRAERQRLIDEVVALNLQLAELIAERYSGRGVERDELLQMASLGLLNAARRFDPEVGNEFVSFAVPAIAGEIKRYFRDHRWTVLPPRRPQELHAATTTASSDHEGRRDEIPLIDAVGERDHGSGGDRGSDRHRAGGGGMPVSVDAAVRCLSFGGCVIVAAHGEVDGRQVNGIRATVGAADSEHLVLDFQRVDTVLPSAAAALAELHRRVQARGGGVCFVTADRGVRAQVRDAALSCIPRFYKDIGDALEASMTARQAARESHATADAAS